MLIKTGQFLVRYEHILTSPARTTLVVNAESEPVREPTDHRCEHCGATFAKAEDLTTHYEAEHSE